MTSDQQNSDEEIIIQQGEETQLETWQGEELPPEDDFHDQPGAETIVADVNETGQEPNPFDGQAAAKKRSGTPVLLGIIAVFAVFIGGMVYLQYGGKEGVGRAAPPTVAEAGSNAAKQKQEQTQSNVADLPVSSAAPKTGISSVYDAGLGKTISPQAGAVAIPGASQPDAGAGKPGETSEARTSEIIATAPLTPASGAAANISVPPTPPAYAGAKPVPPLQQSAAVPAPTLGTTVNVSSQPLPVPADGVEAKIRELTSQVEELKAALQQANQQTNQLAMKLESASGGSSVAGASLEERLGRIEQQILKLSNGKDGKTQERKSYSQPYYDEDSTDITLAKKTENKKAKRTPKARTRKTSSVLKTESAGKENVKWVLRAATPEAAWVSETAESAELRQIKTGDFLPGIGKVLSIKQEGNTWTVVGEKGSVR